MSGTAVAATGGTFILGRSNKADAVTTLTSTSGPALSLRSPAGVAPLHVNRTVRVDRLNADLLDGRDSSAFVRLGGMNTAGRTTFANPGGTPLDLRSAPGAAPLTITSSTKVRHLHADLLDGYNAADFVPKSEFDALAKQHQVLRTEHDALAARVAALETLLAGASRTTVAGRDTLRLSGMNLQLVNGSGQTYSKNGLGNLLVGYNASSPSTGARTGSHYVVVGDHHGWTSTSGVIAGYGHKASGIGASILGGNNHTASGSGAGILGGLGNTASGEGAAVVGGSGNTASGFQSTVTGGMANTASGDPTDPFRIGDHTSVSGGSWNTATGNAASVLGGHKQTASGSHECRPGC